MSSQTSSNLSKEIDAIALLLVLHTRAAHAVPLLDSLLPLFQGNTILLLAGVMLRVAHFNVVEAEDHTINSLEIAPMSAMKEISDLSLANALV